MLKCRFSIEKQIFPFKPLNKTEVYIYKVSYMQERILGPEHFRLIAQ